FVRSLSRTGGDLGRKGLPDHRSDSPLASGGSTSRPGARGAHGAAAVTRKLFRSYTTVGGVAPAAARRAGGRPQGEVHGKESSVGVALSSTGRVSDWNVMSGSSEGA